MSPEKIREDLGIEKNKWRLTRRWLDSRGIKFVDKEWRLVADRKLPFPMPVTARELVDDYVVIPFRAVLDPELEDRDVAILAWLYELAEIVRDVNTGTARKNVMPVKYKLSTNRLKASNLAMPVDSSRVLPAALGRLVEGGYIKRTHGHIEVTGE